MRVVIKLGEKITKLLILCLNDHVNISDRLILDREIVGDNN